MKKILLLIALGTSLTFPAFSQQNKPLSGKIIAENLEVSTVHIINKTQKTGTINTSSGNFSIQVRENDTLLFSSIQYNNLEILITAEVLKKELLSVILTEDVNELSEVNLSNHNLTGNLNTDLANIKVVNDLPLELSFGDVKSAVFKSDINDPQKSPVNIATRQNEIGYGAEGLDIIGGLGLLADLVGIKNKPKPTYSPPAPASVQIRKLFDDEFFRSSLGIKEENIKDFIFYLDDVGLSQQLFIPEQRLALIEVLIVQGTIYNERFAPQR